MEERLHTLRKKMKQNNLGAVIINNKANRYYLSGFTGTDGQILITQTEQYIIADSRYFEQLRQQSANFTIIDNRMAMNTAMKRLLSKIGEQRIGIEADEMNVSEYLALSGADGELVPIYNLIEQQRMIKDEEERNKIQHAALIAGETFNHIIKYIRPGMTEKQVANEIDQYGLKLGADAPAFETIVTSGIRSALPHGHASEKVIQNGELIILDFGFEWRHYYSDITRTIAVGPVSKELRQIFDITLAAQKKAIQTCKKDVPLKSVDKVARDYIAKAGFGNNFLHGTGHGIGLTVHEYPLLNHDSDEQLQNHMTFTVEPGIYLEQKGGIRIEDDIWIDDDGVPVVMTKSPKEWIQL